MKLILASLLLFATCQPGSTNGTNTPEYLAVVQQKMPGNIISDDASPLNGHHFKRSIYLLLPENNQLLIDSISWNGQPLIYEMAKLAYSDQPLEIGQSMPGNKKMNLRSVALKAWWIIRLAHENKTLSSMEKLAAPIKIFSGINTWIIDKEVVIAPAETY